MHDLVSVYTQGTCTTVAGGSGGSFPYCTGAAGGGQKCFTITRLVCPLYKIIKELSLSELSLVIESH